jgi:V8-like Glu-specific endopeptidase
LALATLMWMQEWIMQLKSVDKPRPRPSPFEGLEAAAAPQPREIVDARPGQDDKTSRAAQFLVTGKQQAPIRSPSSVFESLIGDLDRRKQILETDETPWKMICALDITGANGAQMVGTGWFAGPRTVITAGHCVFDPIELGGWATEIRVMPGRNGATMLGDVIAKNFSTTDRWLEAQERDYDYGVIHLDGDLGAASGSFGLAVLPDSELTTLRVNVSGYPVTPGNGERQYFVSIVWGTEAMPDIARRTDPEGRFHVGLPPGRFRVEAVAGDASAQVEVDGGEGPDIVIHLERP